MVSQTDADKTLDFFRDQLFANANVVSISVVQASDDDTLNYVLQVGVVDVQIQERQTSELQDGILLGIPDEQRPVPSSLPIPREPGDDEPTSTIEVRIKKTGPIIAHSFTDRRRPIDGGNSVGNPRYNNAGTIGGVFTFNGSPHVDGFYFLFSNWHVLVGSSGGLGDNIIQPGRLDGGTNPSDFIGDVFWHRLDRFMDAAVVRTNNTNLVKALKTRCFGDFTRRSNGTPRYGDPVKKCGRTSRDTIGKFLSTNASIRVTGSFPGGSKIFDQQYETTKMSDPGDSGSILILDLSWKEAIGLTFAGSSVCSYHNQLGQVIGRFMYELHN